MTCEGCIFLLIQEEAIEQGYIDEIDYRFKVFCKLNNHRLGSPDGCERKIHKTTLNLSEIAKRTQEP